MAKGDGSITEIKKPDGKSYAPKHWRVCVSLGADPITKKRRKVQRNVIGTKSEAIKVRKQIKEEYENGLAIEGDKTTFSEFAQKWHEGRVTNAEVGTSRLKREETIIGNLNKYIGDMRLRDITPQIVESLYTQLRKDKLAEGGKCSGTTMNMTHKMLKQILSKAVDYDMILRNPCDRVKAPKCDTAERRSLSAAEARKLLKKIDEEEASAITALDTMGRRKDYERTHLQGLSNAGNVLGVRIALATGMRRGEVVGRTWGNVDLVNSRIRVAQTVTVYDEVKEPKSEAGKRLVNIDAYTVEHLKAWKVRQKAELEKICIEQGDDTPVCCSDTGGYMNPMNYSRWWRTFAKKCGFEGLHLHELRHTQATQLVASGMDMKTIQHRLGHSSASLTMNLYAHALPENDQRAANLIGNLFSSEPAEANTQELEKSA